MQESIGLTMNTSLENIDEERFADGKDRRDLRVGSSVLGPGARADAERLPEHADAGERPLLLDREIARDGARRIELSDGVEGKQGSSGGNASCNHRTRRVMLAVLLTLALGAVAPFAWNYLHSY